MSDAGATEAAMWRGVIVGGLVAGAALFFMNRSKGPEEPHMEDATFPNRMDSGAQRFARRGSDASLFLTEFRRLDAELQALKNVLGGPGMPSLVPQKTTLASGEEVNITPAEIESMREIFKLFDKTNKGYIDVDDLRALLARLGEPITEEDAKGLLADIGGNTHGIAFDSFIKFWMDFTTHKSRPEDFTISEEERNRRREKHKARFKVMKARIGNPHIGRIITSEKGRPRTLAYRVNFFYDVVGDGKQPVPVSPWHDIPLTNPDGSYNFICEIPKWSRAKFEIATGEPHNPIKQDTKNGTLRNYTWGDIAFNYGAFPQTWEDPQHKHPDTGAIGDNDPLDVIEIGQRRWETGSIVSVKVLGVFAMIDAGETDWKVIVVNQQDPLAEVLNDAQDVDTHCPGLLQAVHDWLKFYKSPTINEFAFDGRCQSRRYAEEIIRDTHEHWKHLIADRGGAATV